MYEKQELIRKFVKKYNLNNTKENIYIDLSSEFGELAKEILKGSNYGNKEYQNTNDLELEFGDVLYSFICLANTLNINLDEALNDTLKKYEDRFNSKNNIGSE